MLLFIVTDFKSHICLILNLFFFFLIQGLFPVQDALKRKLDCAATVKIIENNKQSNKKMILFFFKCNNFTAQGSTLSELDFEEKLYCSEPGCCICCSQMSIASLIAYVFFFVNQTYT